jgi:hypothetical protein
MKIHRNRLIIWLLLPLLLLRAALPAGLMLEFAGGQVSLIICNGMGGAATARQPNASPATAHHAGSHHAADSGTSVCPFAAALSAVGVLPHVTSPLVAQFATVFDLLRSCARHSPFGPPRTQQSRAPPTQYS